MKDSKLEPPAKLILNFWLTEDNTCLLLFSIIEFWGNLLYSTGKLITCRIQTSDLFGAHTFRIVLFAWYIDPFIIMLFFVAQLWPTLCDPRDCSMPSFPVLHYLLEFAQTRIHWISDAIQLSHPLLSLSPPAFNLSQHQGLFQWVGSSYQVANVLELQLQQQSFQWIFRIDFL